MTLDQTADAAHTQTFQAIDAVLNDFNATREQVEQAQRALDAVTQARIDHAEKNISSRTVFLNTLTAQLEAVRNSVQLNPIGNVLSKLTGAITAVNTALSQD